MNSQQLEKLQRDVQYLLDRQAILDCVARHARGHDRHDVELLSGTYWEDGFDEHGHAINPGPQYAQWANAAHEAISCLHTHNITTHLCEINGDEAYAESYVIVGLLAKDQNTAQFISGRYIDHLERRNGEWKIKVRRGSVDLMLTGDASMIKNPVFKDQGYSKGTWDKSDLSYQRPLTVETPAEKW